MRNSLYGKLGFSSKCGPDCADLKVIDVCLVFSFLLFEASCMIHTPGQVFVSAHFQTVYDFIGVKQLPCLCELNVEKDLMIVPNDVIRDSLWGFYGVLLDYTREIASRKRLP